MASDKYPKFLYEFRFKDGAIMYSRHKNPDFMFYLDDEEKKNVKIKRVHENKVIKKQMW